MSGERRAGSGDAAATGNLPLTSLPAEAKAIGYRDDLAAVRHFTAVQAARAGLPPGRVMDLLIAVNELGANTLAHTAGPGTLAIWSTPTESSARSATPDTSPTRWPEPGLAVPTGPTPI